MSPDRWAPLQVAAVTLLVAGVALLLVLGDWLSWMFAGPYVVAGALLAVRRPRHRIGWLLLALGWVCVFATAKVLDPGGIQAGTASPTDTAITWLNSFAWDGVFTGLFSLALVLPTGHLPAGRFRPLARLAIGAMIVLVAVAAFGPTMDVAGYAGGEPVSVPNPGAVLPDLPLWQVLRQQGDRVPWQLAILAFGPVSLFVRYARARGLERLQLRWLVTAVVLTVIAGTFGMIATTVIGGAVQGDPRSNGTAFLLWLPWTIAFPTIPASIVVAVLRYRLFDIDRIVSRTIGYAAITAILVSTFAVGVLGLQTLLEPVTRAQTIPVAISTLLAATLFQPVRRRVQVTVDRAFYRVRADQSAIAQAFAEHLRQDTDLESVTRALRTAVDGTLQPSGSHLWVRRRPGTSA